MDPPAKIEPPLVCADADVLIAGLFSTKGASHALLVLAEIGLVRVAVPSAAVDEVRRNVAAKLPAALPHFERFLAGATVTVVEPGRADLARAKGGAHPKDEPILAGAYAARARVLTTHNVRHFARAEGVRVVRPARLIEELRAWIARWQG